MPDSDIDILLTKVAVKSIAPVNTLVIELVSFPVKLNMPDNINPGSLIKLPLKLISPETDMDIFLDMPPVKFKTPANVL